MNVAVTGMVRSSQTTYVPAAGEFLITAGIVAAGLLVYTYAVQYLPVFEHEPSAPVPEQGPAIRPQPDSPPRGEALLSGR